MSSVNDELPFYIVKKCLKTEENVLNLYQIRRPYPVPFGFNSEPVLFGLSFSTTL